MANPNAIDTSTRLACTPRKNDIVQPTGEDAKGTAFQARRRLVIL
jgi:hypothetical protein